MEDPPVKIVLTADPGTRAKLERKLAEYAARYDVALSAHLASVRDRAGGEAPAPTSFKMARLPYKYLVLKELLARGVVDADALALRLHGELGAHDAYWYKDALQVVDKYNREDLGGLHGGTGLP